MRLKRMEIHGFKSFREKARFDFPAGITAIVGPNGCGKSNVVDALRWAMGEQSVKQLRGKSMEDVIFAGTSGHPPLNMAEVSLTLVNDSGAAPEGLREYSEVMLTRRLFRSGDSAYLINRQPCRRKDITDLFLGSGVGARSYAVIQQGNIGAITDAGPEERRLYIEEAAGITRYKERKRETLRKLEATDQNLMRVQDIVAEVERQINGLQRQVRKAEKYKGYRARIRDLDVRLALDEYDRLTQEIRAGRFRIKELQDREVAHTTQIRRHEDELERVRAERSRREAAVAARRDERFALQREIDRAERDLAHARETVERLTAEAAELARSQEGLADRSEEMAAEVAEGEARLAELTAAVEVGAAELERERAEGSAVREALSAANARREAARKRRSELEAAAERHGNRREEIAAGRERLEGRLRRLEEEAVSADRKRAELESAAAEDRAAAEAATAAVAAAEARLTEARAALDAAGERLRAADQTVREMESQYNAVRSDHAALKRMADSLEWYRDGVRAVLGRKDGNGRVLGLVADLLEPADGFAPAVEAALGEALQYVVVPDTTAAREAIDFLRTENAGRGGFLPLTHLPPAGSGPSGEERLLDHVAVRDGFEPVAEALLGAVGLAPDLPAAEARRNGGRPMVTPAGEVFSDGGVMIGGSADRLDGILSKKRELRQLAERLATLFDQLDAARTTHAEAEADRAEAEAALAAATEARNAATREELAAQKRHYRSAEALTAARRDAERMAEERDGLLDDLDAAESRLAACEADRDAALASLAAARGAESEAVAAAAAAAADAAALEERLTEAKVAQTARETDRANLQKNLERLRAFQTEGADRLEHIAREIADRESRRADAENAVADGRATLAKKREALAAAEAALTAAQSAVAEMADQAQETEAAVAKEREARDAVKGEVQELSVAQQGREVRRQTVESRISERYHRPLAAFRGERDELAGADLSPDQMAEELADLRRKLDRLGDVNLSAISEYEALKERHGFLDKERSDLQAAVADLHKVIRKINRVSQERFLETFAQVNEKLGEVFPRLFEGGAARLELTDPGTPLESGVEFLVHPPGKRLTRMTLLSGGEKALSAIAFVFSIFLIRPAAFCILDEIDAPLDEANVYRFNRLLKLIGEKSQILMITHKRRSMEFADILFGVTMEQKGVSRVVSVNLDESEGLAETG